jgi:hypothetical protein
MVCSSSIQAAVAQATRAVAAPISSGVRGTPEVGERLRGPSSAGRT